jgi:glucan biosynthesis protein C
LSSASQAKVDPAAKPARRVDLDWLRVAAFGLLILYHVALVYGPYDWHIRSRHTFGWIREALLVTSPWRLTLLFLVSGAALRFMTGARSATTVLKARFMRLVPPLLFGAVALVPVQAWIEARDKGFWHDGLMPWVAQEFSPDGIANGVPVNHLWFLLYVCVYTVAAAPLLLSPRMTAWLEGGLDRLLKGWWMIVLPCAYLIGIRLWLFPHLGITNKLNHDWYNHALSFGAFAFGYLIARRETIWRELERMRWAGLALAVITMPLVMIQDIHPGGAAFHEIPRNTVFAIDQWSVLVAVLGFASLYLRRANGPVLAYLRDAVFPCYLAHQTVLVIAVWLLRPADPPAWIEAPILILVTFGGSLAIYEVVKRIPILRPLWGLAPAARASAPYAGRRFLLGFGVAAPALALLSVVLAMAAYPGFDQARQYLSELGGAKASLPMIFNMGVLVSGVMAALAGAGFGLALMALGRARIVGGLTAIVFALAGYGLMIAAIYPWPDPRHLAINLGLGIQLAPVLLLWGLASRRDFAGLKLFLIAIFAFMTVLTVLTKHLMFPSVVNDANVGWWERAYAIVLVGWVGVAAFVLRRRLLLEVSQANPPATSTR